MLNKQSDIFNITGHLPNIYRYLCGHCYHHVKLKNITKTECGHETILSTIIKFQKKKIHKV